jgi:integrase
VYQFTSYVKNWQPYGDKCAHRAIAETVAAHPNPYAIATGHADRDPAAGPRGALAPFLLRNDPAIAPPQRCWQAAPADSRVSDHLATEYALKLLPLVFVRPDELRRGEWPESDFDAAHWQIPSERMKMRDIPLRPLASQALALLRELKLSTGHGAHLLPSIRSS